MLFTAGSALSRLDLVLCLLLLLGLLAPTASFARSLPLHRQRSFRDIYNALRYSPADNLKNGAACFNVKDNERFDCFPEKTGASESQCQSRGCCWAPVPPREGVAVDLLPPFCYYPLGYSSYQLQEYQPLPDGFSNYIAKSRAVPHLPKDVLQLKLTVTYVSSRVVRIRYTDPKNSRWEVPLTLGTPRGDIADRNYEVKAAPSPHGITVKRLTDGAVLFNNIMYQAPLLFTEQFLQLSTQVASNLVFGIGEIHGPLARILTDGWTTYSLYAHDAVPTVGSNLYGVHNFLLGMTSNGKAFGMFFLNSNAQEVELQPTPAITYRTIGGVLDLFIFTAEHPRDVVADYYALIGPPMLPPYWSLGFHLCRYGYPSTAALKKVFDRNRAINLPQDVQWTDIDYMDHYLDWTMDSALFGNLGSFAKNIRDKYGMRYVVIVDPGISNQYPDQYEPYDEGLSLGIFTNKSDVDEPIVGKVWPGTTVYPDFSNPASLPWWTKYMTKFYKESLAFDGLWIDMNEPSNFVPGSLTGCTNNSWDNPPYTPNIAGNDLKSGTVCPSARQTAGRMYDTHNLYGYFEAKVTHGAMKRLYGENQRIFLLSRSTFAGSGRYTYHWTGDIKSDWNELYYSIVQIMNFNFYAIPMTGADICGFSTDSEEELCVRWHQAGAFYPLMRNHNDLMSRDHDPAVWSEPSQRRIRDAIRLRYSLLPYLYTLLHAASAKNQSVVQPLFFQFPQLSVTYSIDTQFMWGESLMIAPVLHSAVSAREVFFPEEGHWCSIPDLQRTFQPLGVMTIPVSMDAIPVFLRGGHILATQGWNDTAPQTATTTVDYRQLPFTLLACANTTASGDAGGAVGEMLWDDGETLDTLTKGTYNRLRAELRQQSRTTFHRRHREYHLSDNGGGELRVSTTYRQLPTEQSNQRLGRVVIMGVNLEAAPSEVTVNGKPCDSFQYDARSDRLTVELKDSPNLWDGVNIAWVG